MPPIFYSMMVSRVRASEPFDCSVPLAMPGISHRRVAGSGCKSKAVWGTNDQQLQPKMLISHGQNSRFATKPTLGIKARFAHMEWAFHAGVDTKN
jgi:hypothetical protein